MGNVILLLQARERTCSVLILTLLLCAINSKLVAQQTLQREPIIKAEKIQLKGLHIGFSLDNPVMVKKEMLDTLRNKENFKVQITMGLDGIFLSGEKRVNAVKPEIDLEEFEVDSVKILGMWFDVMPIISASKELIVRIDMRKDIAQILKVQSTIGPQTVALKIEKGLGIFSTNFDVDADVSRLEQKDEDGALKHDLALNMWWAGQSSDGHINFSTSGTTPLDKQEFSGNFNLGIDAGLLFSPTSLSNTFGGFDVAGELNYDNTSNSSTGTSSIGLSLTVFPRLDKPIGYLVAASGAKTINLPPRVKIYFGYVKSRKNALNLLNESSNFRLGAESDWRIEISEEVYLKLEWRYLYYSESPLNTFGNRHFSYVDLSANKKISEGLYLMMRYTDGKLPPLFEYDNVVTAGLKFEVLPFK